MDACYPLCWTTNKNVNVDIKISAHDTFLEPSAIRYAQNRIIGKPSNLKVFGSNKTKECKHDSQNQPRSSMLQRREP